MELQRNSSRTWQVKYHPEVRSVELSSGLEELLQSYESLQSGEWVQSINGRSIEKVLRTLLGDMQNPERDVSFGELDFSKLKSASTR